MAEAMAVVGLGTSLVGGIMQSQGQRAQGAAALEQGYSQAQTYNYQAGVAEINKTIAKQNQDFAWTVGERQALQFGIGAAHRMGDIKAVQSASGVDVNSGSAVDVRKSQKLIDTLSMDEIRKNTAKTAYDYDVQATQYENQATLYRSAATNSVRAGQLGQQAAEIGAQATLLGSVSSVATRWSSASQSFGWGGGSSRSIVSHEVGHNSGNTFEIS